MTEIFQINHPLQTTRRIHGLARERVRAELKKHVNPAGNSTQNRSKTGQILAHARSQNLQLTRLTRLTQRRRIDA